jgi:hypothetical protein
MHGHPAAFLRHLVPTTIDTLAAQRVSSKIHRTREIARTTPALQQQRGNRFRSIIHHPLVPEGWSRRLNLSTVPVHLDVSYLYTVVQLGKASGGKRSSRRVAYVSPTGRVGGAAEEK